MGTLSYIYSSSVTEISLYGTRLLRYDVHKDN